jgi:hypothetical protein
VLPRISVNSLLFCEKISTSMHDDSVLYEGSNFKLNFPYRIKNLSSRCMNFYATCPSIICTHSIPDVTHTLGQV